MTTYPARPSAWPPLFIVASSIFTACDGCGEDRPYTPFGVASSLPRAPMAASAATVSAAARDSAVPKFQPQKAALAPDKASTWQLGSHALTAPEGQTFRAGLAADLDGDGAEDAVAWVESLGGDPAGGVGYRGALWFFPGHGTGRQLSDLPGFVPNGPDCSVSVDLEQTGPRTVTVDAVGSCSAPRLPRSPTRSLQVMSPGRPEPQLWGLRLAAPAPDEHLSFSVVTTDRDADGLDDVDLTIMLSHTNAERPASMHWVWIDRPAGTSRDESEPAASFANLASVEQVRAAGKKTSKGTLEAVDNARRLQGSACAESSTERLWAWDGSGLRCGSLGMALDRLSHAEVQASIQQHDLIRAFSVLERDGWYGGQVSTTERPKLERLLRDAVSRRAARALRLPERVQETVSVPHYSPLSFDPGGMLLVQTGSGELRRFAEDGTPRPLDTPRSDAGSETQALWPLAPIGPAGERWLGAIQACGRSELSFVFSGVAGSAGTQLATDVPAARPGSCDGRPFTERRPPVPVAWTALGLTALVAGRLIEFGPLSAAVAQVPSGSPLSIDGRWLVVPTELGILLRGQDTAQLWELDSTVRPDALHHCVVSPNAARAACLEGTTIWLVVPDVERSGRAS